MQDAMAGPVVLGAGYFGGLGSPPEFLGLGLDEERAHDVLDRCTALGITFVDTAQLRGGRCQSDHRVVAVQGTRTAAAGSRFSRKWV